MDIERFETGNRWNLTPQGTVTCLDRHPREQGHGLNDWENLERWQQTASKAEREERKLLNTAFCLKTLGIRMFPGQTIEDYVSMNIDHIGTDY